MNGPRAEPPLKRAVRPRAADACEYCRILQADDLRPFELEHTVARKHGGGAELGNLSLACRPCNEAKGTDLCGVDPATGAVVRLFDPRRQRWTDHFRQDGGRVVGLTDCGRATVRLLEMNRRKRIELRSLSAPEDF